MQEDLNDNIANLVKSLNDNPDMLHADFTPAVHRLSKLGLPALRAILPLLNSESEIERLHAQRVLEGVIKRRFGWKPAEGFTDSADDENMRRLLQANGDYDAGSPVHNRFASIEKWKKWLSQNETHE